MSVISTDQREWRNDRHRGGFEIQGLDWGAQPATGSEVCIYLDQ